MADTQTVADHIAAFLEAAGVTHMFGVISIHNMPILDAVTRRGAIRFVPARGEAGAMNMADAYARVSGRLGVCLTSTGTAAGNAAGGQAEALTAGTPLLHLTSQVDAAFADRDKAPIHDVPRQAEMLKGVSKAVYRIWEPQNAQGVLTAAVSAAVSAPSGPVSLEVPVDVQRLPAFAPAALPPIPRQVPRAPDEAVEALAARLRAAKRPLMWLGGGARGAAAEARALAARGVGVVTSTNGRAVVGEDWTASLGAFNMTPDAEAIYAGSDLMLVVGSRLRGNETKNNRMALPPLAQIDAEASQLGRNYPVELAAHGDAADTLRRLLALLPEKLDVDDALAFDIATARAKSEGRLRATLGPYQVIADALSESVMQGARPWVRDVTIANSTFGNRYVPIAAPHLGVHALGGGIGQGVAMALGAALAGAEIGAAKAVALLGDGGAMLGMAELITLVEERAPVALVLMNDQAYGVIQNIQDAQYGGRRDHSKLATPDFAALCASVGMPHRAVKDVDAFAPALDAALAEDGPVLVEVDMLAIGPYAQAFGGPPAGKAQKDG